MSKITQLSQCLTEKYGIQADEANAFISSMFAIIREHIITEHAVKVKGLGTFKSAEMNARESVNINTGERITIEGRYKLSFTPEASVRDRINSPFSQFESIDIDNDEALTKIMEMFQQEEQTSNAEEETSGSKPEATEVKAKVTEVVPELTEVKLEEKEAAPEIAEAETEAIEANSTVTESVYEAINPQPAAVPTEVLESEEPTESQDIPVIPDTPEPQDIPVNPYAPKAKEEPSSTDSAPHEVRSPYCEELIREELEHSRMIITMLKWLIGLLVVVLVGIGMYFVYNLGKQAGRNISNRNAETIEEKLDAKHGDNVADAAQKAAATDTIVPVEKPQPVTEKPQPVEEKAEPKAEKTEVKAENTDAKAKKAESAYPNQDEYNKDARVRTGAYIIIGVDTVVTVQQGQTLKGISKAYLGEGMECYVEVFNGGITSVKPGDKLRIPKVLHKKRIKRNA